MCEVCIRICNAIGELRNTEGASVTIVADNPEFDGANNKIYCCGDWTDWQDRAFDADSVVEALEAAVKAKRGASG